MSPDNAHNAKGCGNKLLEKICTQCGQSKPLSEFGKNKNYIGGYRTQCKKCVSENTQKWRDSDPERHKESKRLSAQNTLIKNQTFVGEYLKNSCCHDCLEDDWVVLEFDHVRGTKHQDIGRMMGRASLDKLIEEIKKCDVVCANCHRRRTYNRAGSWRSEIVTTV